MNNQQMYMVVLVDKCLMAIDIKSIKSIIEPNRIIPYTSVKTHIYGIINVGNILIPIFDAKSKLGHGPSEKSDKNRILLIYAVIDDKEIVFCVLVNDIHKILSDNDLKITNQISESQKEKGKIEVFEVLKFLDSNDIKVIKDFYEFNEELCI